MPLAQAVKVAGCAFFKWSCIALGLDWARLHGDSRAGALNRRFLIIFTRILPRLSENSSPIHRASLHSTRANFHKRGLCEYCCHVDRRIVGSDKGKTVFGRSLMV